ncbi:MAG: hypothetical protein DRI98_08060 [Bacteroidetes bacterium]|nr:MAG: hypothetical protein DRI98_08060 [Bacteroidota bacterium]
MILQEFIFNEKGLDRLNKTKKEFKGKEDYCDDGIKPDCKCPYGDVDPKDCEDLCRHQMK